jgi:ATP-dependent Clp protease ATP-binding subunit ClpB
VQRLLQNPLALAVLEGRFKEGDTIIAEVDPNAETLTFAHGDPIDAAAPAAFDEATARR